MEPRCVYTRLSGRGASPGRATGPIVRLAAFQPSGRRAPRDDAGALDAAFSAAARDLSRLFAREPQGGADCLEFQLALLDDEALTGPLRAEIGRGVAGDLAWRRATDALIADYAEHPSEYVRARSLDVADLRDRVLQALDEERAPPAPPPGAIVVADDLPPSRFLEIDWSQGGGVALARGSALSHTAILARARGVPMLVQVGEVPAAERAVLDADGGWLDLDPGPSEAAREAGAPARAAPRSGRLVYRGERVRLLLNIEGPESLESPAAQGADGVGLMRTEFLLRDLDFARDEKRQADAYVQVLRWAAGRPVTIRTLDLGGDKGFAGLEARDEPNPALGLRGLRLSLRRPDLFRSQLRALCRAAAAGPLRVMFPFVTTPQEFLAARALADEALAQLQREDAAARAPEYGMMVETPAAALTLADFPARFFSIGSNDLTQFTLACDRGDGALVELYDPLHPAVAALLGRVVEEGRASGRETSLCGDIAGDPARTQALLEIGLRHLSMSPNALPALRERILELAQAPA